MTDIAEITAPGAGYDELLEGLRATFAAGTTRPLAWRREQLKAMLRLLTENEAALSAAITEDLGRHPLEAYSLDVGVSLLHIKHMLKHLADWMKPQRVSPGMLALPGTAEIISEPLGVVLVIAPWNYPIQLLVVPLAAALAAGNCVVAKPSELSAATSSLLASLIPKYLDTSAVAVVEGAVAETTALLERRFDHIFFTGSTPVGRVVMQAAAKHLTPVTLELGGKSPTIVAADADINVAARRIAYGKSVNAGQTCVAPDYVLVHNSVKLRLVERLRHEIAEFFGPDQSSSESFGRIVSERHLERLRGLADSAGGEVHAAGEADSARRYMPTTIIVDPDPASTLMQEEIFGPVLPVIGVDSIDEAIAFVNAREKPLALYVFTGNQAVADTVLAETSSGGACINHTLMHLVPDELPFGGVGTAGTGSYHGKASFDTFSHRKSVLRKPTRFDPKFLYPPYTGLKSKLLRTVFR
jgi:aldehyde dehydrogenase (NAD+)